MAAHVTTGRPAVLLAGALAAVLLAAAPAARATTFAVTTPGPNPGTPSDGLCSLQEALVAASTNSASGTTAGECPAGSMERDRITVPAGQYLLHDTLIDGTFGPVTIAGAAAATTIIKATTASRLLTFVGAGDHFIRDVTLTGGRPGTQSTVDPSSEPGGAILNTSVLTIERCVLKDNAAGPGRSSRPDLVPPHPAGVDGGSGGAIGNSGALTVRDSVLTDNRAGDGGDALVSEPVKGDPGSNGGSGGANNPGGVGKTARGASGGNGGDGGAIASTGPLVVERSILSSNVAGNGGVAQGAEGGTGGLGGFARAGGGGGSAFGGQGGRGGSGGAIWMATGRLTVDSSAVTGNLAGHGNTGGSAKGGAGGRGGDGGIGRGGAGGSAGDSFGGYGGPGGGGGGISIPAYDAGSAATPVIRNSLVTGNSSSYGGLGGVATGAAGGNAGGGALSSNGGAGGTALAGGGGMGGSGGGIAGDGMASPSPTFTNHLQFDNLTVTGNATGYGGGGATATVGPGGAPGNSGGSPGWPGIALGGLGAKGGAGGGIAYVELTAAHATVSSNSTGTGGSAGSPGGGSGARGRGGGLYSSTTHGQLANSIASANEPDNCDATLSGGHNISFPEPSCGGTNADPKLAPLGENGGMTKTQALGGGSAARDIVPPTGASCALTDQRGLARPQLSGCDAGAYEAAPPAVTTGAASGTTATTASLAGSVDPHLREASYHFEYGTSTAYGSSTASASAGSGTGAQPVTAGLSTLTPGTTYHYRLVATNGDGSSTGEDQSFTPSDQPAGGGGSSGSDDGGSHAGTPDTTPPAFLSLSLTPRRVTKKGARFKFVLSEQATVLIRIERIVRRKRVPSGKLKANGIAGRNTKKLPIRIGKRRLKRGRYRATLVATDAAGNASAPRRIGFRVV